MDLELPLPLGKATLRRLAQPRSHRTLGAASSLSVTLPALATSFALCALQLAPAEDTAKEGAERPRNALKLAAKLPQEQRDRIDRSIAAAFRSILAAQDKDGMIPAKGDGTAGNEVASTGLAAVAMLSHGGAEEGSPYREPMARAIAYVLSCQDAEGRFNQARGGKFGNMYHHCIATWSVALLHDSLEVAQQKAISGRLELAVKVILDAQAVVKNGANRGGWRYTPISRDSDISVSAWAIRALSAAMVAGVHVPPEAIDDAMGYVAKLQNEDGGFGYVNGAGQSSLTRTAMGLHCVELVGDFRFAAERNALDYIEKHYKEPRETWPYYTMFWLSSGLRRIGDTDEFAEWLFAECLPTQKDGVWHGGTGGDLLSTIFVLLAYAPPMD